MKGKVLMIVALFLLMTFIMFSIFSCTSGGKSGGTNSKDTKTYCRGCRQVIPYWDSNGLCSSCEYKMGLKK